MLDVHQLAADFVHRVILVHHECVRQRVQTRQSENRIVVLHDNLQREENTDRLARQFNSILLKPVIRDAVAGSTMTDYTLFTCTMCCTLMTSVRF